ncbi:hypothetical protein PAXRUDRAFT_99534, partial [Paxillus rubicundulus Ve08.2h10]
LLLDQTGVIMAWHLPGVLSKEFQVGFQCLVSISIILLTPGRGTVSWRTQEDLFTKSHIRGAIEFSPAWYQQGHMSEVSAILKGSHADPGPQQWLQAGALQTTILSATLVVMHPNLYALGRETFLKLANSTLDKGIQQIIPEWSTVYLVVLVIVNRATPFHRDLSFQVQWLDMLATMGGDLNLHIELDNLGVRLAYSLGTVVNLSGKVLQHGVPALVSDCFCLAYHMRDNVQEGVGVHRCDWVKQGELPIL